MFLLDQLCSKDQSARRFAADIVLSVPLSSLAHVVTTMSLRTHAMHFCPPTLRWNVQIQVHSYHSALNNAVLWVHHFVSKPLASSRSSRLMIYAKRFDHIINLDGIGWNINWYQYDLIVHNHIINDSMYHIDSIHQMYISLTWSRCGFTTRTGSNQLRSNRTKHFLPQIVSAGPSGGLSQGSTAFGRKTWSKDSDRHARTCEQLERRCSKMHKHKLTRINSQRERETLWAQMRF